MDVIVKPGIAHVHGLDDSTPIIEFIDKHGRQEKNARGGVEPPRPKAQDPKSSASANFATLAVSAAKDILAGPDCVFNTTRTANREFAGI